MSWYQARSPGGEASVSAAAMQSWRTDDVWYSWWRHRKRQRGRRWWRPRGPLSLPRPSTANRLQHPLSAFSKTLHASIHIIFSTNRPNRSFLPVCFPRLWNQLPASLRQPCTNLYNSDSLSSFSGTSSIGCIDSPLSSSITPSLFHSRLKTFLFCKSFPPQPSFSSSKLTPRIPPLFTDTSEHRPISFFLNF